MDRSSQDTEHDRVIREHAQQGDYRQAIAVCTRTYEQPLTAYCTERLNAADAEDTVQEILVAAFDAMPTLAQATSVQAWLLDIADHICARRVEARTPKPEPSELEKRVLAAVAARGPSVEPRKPSTDATADDAPADKPSATTTTSAPRPPWLIPAVAALGLLAVTLGLMQRGGSSKTSLTDTHPIDGALTATVTQIQRAGAGDATVDVRTNGKDTFAPVETGSTLGAGSTIRTDARTRIELRLSDGSLLRIGHDTELALDETRPRHVHLSRGEVLADVVHLDDAPPAQILTPSGRIEVVGTKLHVRADADLTSVRVSQGAVRLHGGDGQVSELQPGQEAWVARGGPASIVPAVDLASSLAWGDAESDTGGLRGLGELRAKRPGERQDTDRPLSLSAHRVDVKIAGNLARTEIEETFTNDGPHELEGIYRFPLPPDAQIASLSLLVDGVWMDGGFVERDRAKKIWRGVIRNATPEQQRQKEEYIWVPGPWRDPALLEWQNGGQFELRIFPIPARGSRSVRLAYTELLPAQARGRRYSYPLPHSNDPKLRVGTFDANVRIIGSQDAQAHSTGSYPLQRAQDGNAVVLTYSERDFSPAGDLTVDLIDEDRAELRTFGFSGSATAPPPADSREGDPEVLREHRNLHSDNSHYAAFVLRPSLPASRGFSPRDHVLVIDASQSMVGERYRRSADLAATLVHEMDRRDRVRVLACDNTCVAMADHPEHASPELSERARSWLSTIEPAGGSDLVAVLRHAVNVGTRDRDHRDVHVLYIGDGSATTGHRRASSIANEVAALCASSSATVTTIGIGADADALSLGAIARAGGGHYLPYRPGETLSTVALRTLETTYGTVLRNAWLELPSGIDRVAPGTLPNLRSGEEVVVVGRMRAPEIVGDAILHGEIGGERFEKRIAMKLRASTDKGNAFVPTLWSQRTIEQLQLDGRGEDVPRIIALSKAFNVMSRHTSLLVLESEAMFRAFGVDRAAAAATWTGEEAADSESSDSETDSITSLLAGADQGMERLARSAGGGLSEGLGGLNSLAASGGSAKVASGMRDEAPRAAPASAPAPARASAAARPMEAESLAAFDDGAPVPQQPPSRVLEIPRPMPLPQPPPRGQWMRKIWVKAGEIRTDTAPRAADVKAVAVAEAALTAQPDSRDRHRSLVRALSAAGQLQQAEQVAEQWLQRDQLDPEALTYLSDAVGRAGHRDRALRLLSGVVDLRAGDAVLHERLAKAFDRAGDQARACAHRVSLAEIKADAVDTVAAAVRCERDLGHATGARSLLDSLKQPTLRTKVEQAAARAANMGPPRGELLIEGRWSNHADLDISIVTNEGTRVSWMGGRVNAVGRDAQALGRETLGLATVTAGTYRIEVSRVDPNHRDAISGDLDIRVLNERRTLRFNLRDANAQVGTVRVTREQRLVPSSAPPNR